MGEAVDGVHAQTKGDLVSADLLRRAAAKIRETAQASAESGGGPWWTTSEVVGIIGVNRYWDTPDAEHIALWSPDVAELVAGVIDLHADVWEVNGGEMEKLNPIRKLAERILGEDA